MASSSTSTDGTWPCPFREFHCCPNGGVENKRITRLISHIKSVHFSNDDRKNLLRDAISTNHGLFKAVEETLKVCGQWMCGPCMRIHAMNRFCHHADGLVRFIGRPGELSGRIVGILNPSSQDPDIVVNDRVVLDVHILHRIFKQPITTVKSIPHSCRMAFSQALKVALNKVVAQPGSVEAWIKLLLFPRCILRVFRPSNRQESRSGNRKASQVRSIRDSLAMWEKDDGIVTLINNILDISGPGPQGKGGDDSPQEEKTSSNVRQCLRKVADGHFTAAVKALCSSGVAPYNDDTMKALEAKHPFKSPPTMPSNGFSESPLSTGIDTVLGCVKSFPKGTSCGRDGLRAQHILDALCGEGSAIANDLLLAITAVVNLWLGGDVR